MNWQLLGPLLVTAAIAIGGWFVGHTLTARRDRANRKRDQRIDYLVEAYRRLESCAHRQPGQLDASKFESAVGDIQLFGSARQVELVQELITKYAAGGGASFGYVLEDLRRDLRSELRLEEVPEKVLHLRIKNENKAA